MPCSKVSSETSVTDANTKRASQAEPRRMRVRIAMMYTDAYVSHFSASAMEAEGSSDNGALRSVGSPNGTRQRNQTPAEIGDRCCSQATGKRTACSTENRLNAANTSAGQDDDVAQ